LLSYHITIRNGKNTK